MKILILGANHAPELTGIGKYTGEMAEWLAEQGHQVRVVSAPPYYPEWKIHDGYAGWRYSREWRAGVDVRRCPLYVPARPGGLKRILHLFSFALSSFPVMLGQVFWKPDIVLVIEPPLFCAPAAWLTARLSGAKCWIHIQDLEVDAAFSLGIVRAAFIRKFILGIESFLLRRFDRVSTLSGKMLQCVLSKGCEAERVVMFPNWADLDCVRYDPEGGKRFRAAHGIAESDFLALYAGNMGEKQGLEVILDAAARLADKPVRFLMCGEGASRLRLEKKAQGLENVSFISLQPKQMLPGMLSAADLHLVVQKAGAADLVLPSKLTNILAVGGYALVTAEKHTELGGMLARHPELGLLCDPGNVEQVLSAIVRVSQARPAGAARSAIRNIAEQDMDKEGILGGFAQFLSELHLE